MEARAAPTNIATAANQVAKETPVSIPPSITYGLQNTHTTILPFRTYVTGAVLSNHADQYLGGALECRLNSIYDVIGTTLLNPVTLGINVDGWWSSKGVIDMNPATSYTGTNLFNYPTSVAEGTITAFETNPPTLGPD